MKTSWQKRIDVPLQVSRSVGKYKNISSKHYNKSLVMSFPDLVLAVSRKGKSSEQKLEEGEGRESFLLPPPLPSPPICSL